MISVFGTLITLRGILVLPELFRVGAQWQEALVLMLVFMVLSRWSVTLPSGAAWRPALALVTVGMFLLPPSVTGLVALPGLLYTSLRPKRHWWRYVQTCAQVIVSLFAGACAYRYFATDTPLLLPQILPAGVASLAIYVFVSRTIAAAIIAQRDENRFLRQLRVLLDELHWGYLNSYTLSFLIALLTQAQGWWGLLMAAIVQGGLFQSVSYYHRLKTLQTIAWTDGLTGVSNRSAWEHFWQKGLQRGQSGSLYVIDIDNLKEVNDDHGHQVGDAVLQELTARLGSGLPESARVYRYGGDEFTVFFPHAPSDRESAHALLCAKFQEVTEVWAGKDLPSRVSFGSAVYPQDGDTLETLFALADRRMYEQKVAHKVG